MRNACKLTLALATALAGGAGHAQIAGTLDAQIVLESGCIVSGAPNAGTTGVDFGTLDFGTQPSTFTGTLTARAAGGAGGAGNTSITCSPDIAAMSVSISAGNNSGQGSGIGSGSRAMSLGGTAYLPYEVYSDAGMATPYVPNTPVPVPLPGDGTAVELPIYGGINKSSAAALPAGTYQDVLQVTVAW